MTKCVQHSWYIFNFVQIQPALFCKDEASGINCDLNNMSLLKRDLL